MWKNNVKRDNLPRRRCSIFKVFEWVLDGCYSTGSFNLCKDARMKMFQKSNKKTWNVAKKVWNGIHQLLHTLSILQALGWPLGARNPSSSLWESLRETQRKLDFKVHVKQFSLEDMELCTFATPQASHTAWLPKNPGWSQTKSYYAMKIIVELQNTTQDISCDYADSQNLGIGMNSGCLQSRKKVKQKEFRNAL